MTQRISYLGEGNSGEGEEEGGCINLGINIISYPVPTI